MLFVEGEKDVGRFWDSEDASRGHVLVMFERLSAYDRLTQSDLLADSATV